MQTNQLEKLLTKAQDIQKATKEDEVLSEVCEYIQKYWPAHKRNVSKEVQSYFQKQFQLTIHSGCILHGLQIVISSKMCNTVITELHKTHDQVKTAFLLQ